VILVGDAFIGVDEGGFGRERARGRDLRSSGVVWDVLTDLEAWPSWNPDVKAMSITGAMAEDGSNVFERVVQTLARSVRGETEAPGEHLGRISARPTNVAAIARTAEEAS
jgi:hypothetical protein